MRGLQAAFYGALFTMFGGSIYYLISLANTLATGGDVVQNFVDTVIGCLLAWGFFTYVFYQLIGAFDELNKRGREEAERRSQQNKQDQRDPQDPQ